MYIPSDEHNKQASSYRLLPYKKASFLWSNVLPIPTSISVNLVLSLHSQNKIKLLLGQGLRVSGEWRAPYFSNGRQWLCELGDGFWAQPGEWNTSSSEQTVHPPWTIWGCLFCWMDHNRDSFSQTVCGLGNLLHNLRKSCNAWLFAVAMVEGFFLQLHGSKEVLGLLAANTIPEWCLLGLCFEILSAELHICSIL